MVYVLQQAVCIIEICPRASLHPSPEDPCFLHFIFSSLFILLEHTSGSLLKGCLGDTFLRAYMLQLSLFSNSIENLASMDFYIGNFCPLEFQRHFLFPVLPQVNLTLSGPL